MTIEERLLKKYGQTTNPELAVWMLQDGTMVNGSYGGRVREMDHLEINEFYKPSIRAVPGSGIIYIEKFMRRGNIRMGCNDAVACFSYMKTPTESQLKVICSFMERYHQQGKQTAIGHWRKDHLVDWKVFPAFIHHLYQYTKAAIPRNCIHYVFDEYGD